VQTLYIALLVAIVAILAAAGALYWRVRRLANASNTQFMRAVKEKNPDPSAEPQP
jgi:Flp pilus assembly protein TadB